MIVCIEEEKNEQKDQSKMDKKKLNKGLKEKSEEKNEKTGKEEKLSLCRCQASEGHSQYREPLQAFLPL